jgi:hypothetical protein
MPKDDMEIGSPPTNYAPTYQSPNIFKGGFEVMAYISIARPDHWFKNVFMLFGVLLAFFIEPDLIRTNWRAITCLAVLSTCLIASSNYVINEILNYPLFNHIMEKGNSREKNDSRIF